MILTGHSRESIIGKQSYRNVAGCLDTIICLKRVSYSQRYPLAIKF